jgi:hypothetical protein
VNIPTAHTDPMNANGDPDKLIQPRCAAHATTAGAVMARSPASKPMPNDSSNPSPEFISILLFGEGKTSGEKLE